MSLLEFALQIKINELLSYYEGQEIQLYLGVFTRIFVLGFYKPVL